MIYLESSEVEVYDRGNEILKKTTIKSIAMNIIGVHKDLDKTRLIPKLLKCGRNAGYYYFHIEKIDSIDSNVRQQMKTFDVDTYYDSLERMEDRYSIEDYEQELLLYDYSLVDIHLGNFGFMDKRIVCLDEGCFSKIYSNDLIDEMLS